MTKTYTFRSEFRRDTVYDPAKDKRILAEFRDHKFTTKSKAVAEKLRTLGYEEWTELTEEDEIELPSGKRIKLRELPEGIRKEIVGKPIAGIKKVVSKIPGLSSGEEQNPAQFVCELCGKVWPSQAALNGHMGSHSQKSE